jgi:glycosyltransferase involved in cell wall biosynthesis
VKKILVISCVTYGGSSGASIHLKELVENLIFFNNKVFLLVARLAADKSIRGYYVKQVKPVDIRFLRQISWNILGTLHALKLLRSLDIDVIYSRMDPGDFVGLIISKLLNVPIIYELNGLPTADVKLYRPSNFLLIKFSKWWEESCYKTAARLVGSRGYLEFVKRHFHVSGEKLREAPLGANIKIYNPDNQFDDESKLDFYDKNCCYVVWVGNIAKWQGLITVIDAAKHVLDQSEDVKFVIVGDGVFLSEVKEHANLIRSSQNIVFTGRVAYDVVPKYINIAKCCVGSFPGNRGDKGTISALKTVSYLACGKPVITTEMDDLGDDIVNKELGLVVPPDDSVALASAIIEIVNMNQSSIDELKYRAINFVYTTRTWPVVSDRINSYIHEITDK